MKFRKHLLQTLEIIIILKLRFLTNKCMVGGQYAPAKFSSIVNLNFFMFPFAFSRLCKKLQIVATFGLELYSSTQFFLSIYSVF